MLKKGDGTVDWTLPAMQIERMIRAYDPWPGAQTCWRGQGLRLIAATLTSDGSGGSAPGTIIGQGAGRGPLVATGAGLLELREIQPAGRRPMSGEAWLAGLRDREGRFGV